MLPTELPYYGTIYRGPLEDGVLRRWHVIDRADGYARCGYQPWYGWLDTERIGALDEGPDEVVCKVCRKHRQEIT